MRRSESDNRYMIVLDAIPGTAMRKCRLTLNLCKALGAKSVHILNAQADSSNVDVGNEYTAGTRAEHGRTKPGKPPNPNLAADEETTVKVAAQLRHQLRTTIEAAGIWPGNEPSIEDAQNLLDGSATEDVEDLHFLIEQRSGSHNLANGISITVNFLSELSHDFTLFFTAAAGVEAALGKQHAKTRSSMSNTFTAQFEKTRTISMSLKVEF